MNKNFAEVGVTPAWCQSHLSVTYFTGTQPLVEVYADDNNLQLSMPKRKAL